MRAPQPVEGEQSCCGVRAAPSHSCSNWDALVNVQMCVWLNIDVFREDSGSDQRQVVVIDRNGVGVLTFDADRQVVTGQSRDVVEYRHSLIDRGDIVKPLVAGGTH